jgi:hypothetical protein
MYRVKDKYGSISDIFIISNFRFVKQNIREKNQKKKRRKAFRNYLKRETRKNENITNKMKTNGSIADSRAMLIWCNT